MLVAIRLAMAREMTSKDGEDVWGCRMAAIDCVILSTLFEEIKSDKTEHDAAGKKIAT